MNPPKFSPFLMETPVPARPSARRKAAVVAMFFGVQALAVVGSYYCRRYPYKGSPLSLAQHLLIFVVANVLVFGVGALLRLRKSRLAA